jgi:hypothetical protein
LGWRWTAWRLALSAFIIWHVSALIIWTIPPSVIKARFEPPFRYYVLPLGIWQWWAIFAPDPMKDDLYLESEVVDAKGMRRLFEFPTIGDLPWWAKLSRYRHPKFTSNMMNEEYTVHRRFTCRHVLRQLDLNDDAYPLMVSLYVRVKPTPPFGTAVADPMTPSHIQMIDRFEFTSSKEVRQ